MVDIVANDDAWARGENARFWSLAIFSRHPLSRRMSVPGFGQSKSTPKQRSEG